MNVLFLVTRYSMLDEHRTLEKELVNAFANDPKNKVYVATITERRFKEKTHITQKDNITILNIKVGNLYNEVSMLEKKITAATLSTLYPRAIKKHFKDINIDWIVTYTPYLSSSKLISPLKKFFNAKATVMHWDIFPQNAENLGIIKNKLLLSYFKIQQKKMLKEYEVIACNSQGNIDYFLNPKFSLDNNKFHLYPNAETITRPLKVDRAETRNKHGFSDNDIILMFGGNIGRPQHLENIIFLAEQLKAHKDIKFLIVGQGCEAENIKALSKKQANITFIDFLARDEYEVLLISCDIGILSLSPKFTVPNFPAKLTGYLKNGLAVLALVDQAAYNDAGQFIKHHHLGAAFLGENIKNNLEEIKQFILNKEQLTAMKINALNIYKEQFDIDICYPNLLKKMESVSHLAIS